MLYHITHSQDDQLAWFKAHSLGGSFYAGVKFFPQEYGLHLNLWSFNMRFPFIIAPSKPDMIGPAPLVIDDSSPIIVQQGEPSFLISHQKIRMSKAEIDALAWGGNLQAVKPNCSDLMSRFGDEDPRDCMVLFFSMFWDLAFMHLGVLTEGSFDGFGHNSVPDGRGGLKVVKTGALIVSTKDKIDAWKPDFEAWVRCMSANLNPHITAAILPFLLQNEHELKHIVAVYDYFAKSDGMGRHPEGMVALASMAKDNFDADLDTIFATDGEVERLVSEIEVAPFPDLPKLTKKAKSSLILA